MSSVTAARPSISKHVRSLHALKEDCEEVARTEPGDTHKMASLLQQMSLNYYEDVRRQAQQSFYCALVAALIGVLFFFYAAYLMMNQDSASNAKVSLIAGALVQVISGINFYFYGKASRQFASFHICLERTNRFLLANTLCENLLCKDRRDLMRTELIRVISTSPMLTLDVISNGAPQQELTQSNWKSVRNPDNGRSPNNSNKEIVEVSTSQVVTDDKS
jgi:hypothetical protein